MPITRELISQQQIDTPFTDSQIALIERLSQNVEDQVIHDKTKEWYNSLDQTILDASGVPKEAREKATDYAKRAFAALKSDADASSTYKTKVSALETEIAALKEGKQDAVSAQKITDLKSEIASLKENHAVQLREKDEALAIHEKAIQEERFESAFTSALLGVNFKKDDTTTAIKDTLLEAEKAKFKSQYTPDIVDGKRVWRDKEGNIVRNAKNGNEYATAADLILPKLQPIIDAGRKITGTGLSGASGGSDPSGFVPTAKTRVEFDRQAADYLIAQGLERTKPEFAAKLTELRKEFDVSSLPVT